MKFIFFFLLAFIGMPYLQNKIFGQVAITRLVKGGNRIETMYFYSDKTSMDNNRKKDEALHCYNCRRLYYLIKPKTLQQVSKYINANCKPSVKYLGKLNNDIYEINLGQNSKVLKLNEADGKMFLKRFRKWMMRASFAEEAKDINFKLQQRFINSN